MSAPDFHKSYKFDKGAKIRDISIAFDIHIAPI